MSSVYFNVFTTTVVKHTYLVPTIEIAHTNAHSIIIHYTLSNHTFVSSSLWKNRLVKLKYVQLFHMTAVAVAEQFNAFCVQMNAIAHHTTQ